MLTSIRSKVAWATFGTALNGLGWFLASKFDWFGIAGWEATDVVTASGFTAAILAFLFGYQVPDEMSPVKGDGVGPLPEDAIPPSE